MNKKSLIIILLMLFILSGCKMDRKKTVSNDTPPKVTVVHNDKPSKDYNEPEVPKNPDKDKVLEMRSAALEGMTENDINWLTTSIAKANLRLEQAFLYGDLEDRLSDPDSYYWNYLEHTGEILIGYAYDEEDLNKKDSLNLTDKEFEEKYGQKITTNNDYDADRIIEILSDLKSVINEEDLKQDFENMIEDINKAEENHDIQYMIDFYRILHDMDYYLLRYGPEDVGKYVQDPSTINIYYGVLTCYN